MGQGLWILEQNNLKKNKCQFYAPELPIINIGTYFMRCTVKTPSKYPLTYVAIFLSVPHVYLYFVFMRL